MSGFWTHIFRRRHNDDPATIPASRSTLAITRARARAVEHGWIFSEQQEQTLSDTLQQLSCFGFHPSTPIDIAYVACHCPGGLTRFMAQPGRVLLNLRGPELEPLFNRVLLPHPDSLHDEDSYMDLLWEAAAVAETAEFLRNISITTDLDDPWQGTLSYTFAQRRVTHQVQFDLPQGDPKVIAGIAANVSPTNFDLISDEGNFYCWVRTRSTREFLAFLQQRG